MIIKTMGIDPGKVNMAYCVLMYDTTSRKFKFGKVGKFVDTVQDLKLMNLKGSVMKFVNEFESVRSTEALYEVVMERFQGRGIRGALSEFINVMVGAVIAAPNVSMARLITASLWKNHFNKQNNVKLDYFYKEANVFGVEPHELDASLIARFHIAKDTFNQFSNIEYRMQWLHRIAKAKGLVVDLHDCFMRCASGKPRKKPQRKSKDV